MPTLIKGIVAWSALLFVCLEGLVAADSLLAAAELTGTSCDAGKPVGANAGSCLSKALLQWNQRKHSARVAEDSARDQEQILVSDDGDAMPPEEDWTNFKPAEEIFNQNADEVNEVVGALPTASSIERPTEADLSMRSSKPVHMPREPADLDEADSSREVEVSDVSPAAKMSDAIDLRTADENFEHRRVSTEPRAVDERAGVYQMPPKTEQQAEADMQLVSPGEDVQAQGDLLPMTQTGLVKMKLPINVIAGEDQAAADRLQEDVRKMTKHTGWRPPHLQHHHRSHVGHQQFHQMHQTPQVATPAELPGASRSAHSFSKRRSESLSVPQERELSQAMVEVKDLNADMQRLRADISRLQKQALDDSTSRFLQHMPAQATQLSDHVQKQLPKAENNTAGNTTENVTAATGNNTNATNVTQVKPKVFNTTEAPVFEATTTMEPITTTTTVTTTMSLTLPPPIRCKKLTPKKKKKVPCCDGLKKTIKDWLLKYDKKQQTSMKKMEKRLNEKIDKLSGNPTKAEVHISQPGSPTVQQVAPCGGGPCGAPTVQQEASPSMSVPVSVPVSVQAPAAPDVPTTELLTTTTTTEEPTTTETEAEPQPLVIAPRRVVAGAPAPYPSKDDRRYPSEDDRRPPSRRGRPSSKRRRKGGGSPSPYYDEPAPSPYYDEDYDNYDNDDYYPEPPPRRAAPPSPPTVVYMPAPAPSPVMYMPAPAPPEVVYAPPPYATLPAPAPASVPMCYIPPCEVASPAASPPSLVMQNTPQLQQMQQPQQAQASVQQQPLQLTLNLPPQSQQQQQQALLMQQGQQLRLPQQQAQQLQLQQMPQQLPLQPQLQPFMQPQQAPPLMQGPPMTVLAEVPGQQSYANAAAMNAVGMAQQEFGTAAQAWVSPMQVSYMP